MKFLFKKKKKSRSKNTFRKFKIFLSFLFFLGALLSTWPPVQSLIAVTHLSDPVKLASLEKRGANPRVNKIVYWLHRSNEYQVSPEIILSIALLINGIHGERGLLTQQTMLRNIKIAQELGLFNEKNKNRLRHGKAGIVIFGPYKGDQVEIDHIIPVSLAPEIGNELANLEMMPSTLNRKKSNRITSRQIAYAEKFYDIGLIEENTISQIRNRLK